MTDNKPVNYSDGRPFDYSKRKVDLTNAYVSLRFENGEILEPQSKHYKNLNRKGLVEAVIKSSEHVPLYTFKIIDEQFAYRKRSFAKPFHEKGQWTLVQPKRCIVLATKGCITFFWDSREVKTFDSWQNDSIYNQRDMKEVDV